MVEIPEYTAICPKTALPDFGHLTIRYVPDERCLELKSLKLYVVAYRNVGIFYENAVNRILRDCAAACRPKRMTVTGRFSRRRRHLVGRRSAIPGRLTPMEWLKDLFHKLTDVENLVRVGGLTAMTAIIFAETGLMIGFFLPGDSLLVTAGVFAAMGQLNIWAVNGLLIVAAIVGDTVGYWFGRRVGPALFTRPKSLLFNPDHLRRAHDFYEKHGGKTIIIARFMPIIRTFAPIVAGMGEMGVPPVPVLQRLRRSFLGDLDDRDRLLPGTDPGSARSHRGRHPGRGVPLDPARDHRVREGEAQKEKSRA